MKIIHFVCTGNVYRSRLAEAYFNSLDLKDYKAISSGIMASNNDSGPICWYAERILKNNNLLFFMTEYWTLTTQKMLETSNLNVFMDNTHFEFSKKYLGYTGSNYIIWDIPDFECHYHADPKTTMEEDISHLEESEQTFTLIRKNINELIEKLKSAAERS